MVTTNDLPWCRTRAILLLLLFVACILGGGPCMQMFLKHKQTQNLVNKTVPLPITVDIRYQDVEITAILLFSITQLLCLMSTLPLFLILQDMCHINIVPAALVRPLKLNKPLSNSTITCQAWGLLISAILFTVTLAVHTPLVFTRTAKVIVSSGGLQLPVSTVQSYLNALGIDLRYRYTPYIRATAEFPWAMVFVSVPNILMAFAARQRIRAQSAAETMVPVLHTATSTSSA